MNRNRKMLTTIIAGIALGAAFAAGTAGCSDQLNDLGGIGQKQPDFTITYLNVSGFPNVTLLCIDGAGFATTTRDNNAAIQRVPEWDSFCAAHKKLP